MDANALIAPGGVIVVAITAFGAWYAARQGGHARSRQADTDGGRARAQEWGALFAEVRENARQAQICAREAQQQAESVREENIVHERRIDQLEDDLHSAGRRIRQLEHREREFVLYIARLRDALRRAGIAPPEPPPDLGIEYHIT